MSASVSGLMARVLLALVPGVAVLVYFEGPGLLARLALAIAFALALEATALHLRGQPLRPFLGDGSAVLCAVLLVLWLPALSGWALLLAVFAGIALAKQAFGGLGANPFNPAMAGAALAQLLFAPPVTPHAAPEALAAAWAVGGLALCAMRIVRWQAPVGLLAGVALATLAIGGEALAPASAPWLLAAFFVVSDPVSGCENGRARLLFAALVGAVAVAASPPGRVEALPFAVLAMNALAPGLDGWLAPQRRAPAL